MIVSTDFLPSTDLPPSPDPLTYDSNPWSKSEKFEKFESRGVELVSKLSNKGFMRSVLGLPELTKDISLFACENSYGFPFGPFLLVNGDLLPRITRLSSVHLRDKGDFPNKTYCVHSPK